MKKGSAHTKLRAVPDEYAIILNTRKPTVNCT